MILCRRSQSIYIYIYIYIKDFKDVKEFNYDFVSEKPKLTKSKKDIILLSSYFPLLALFPVSNEGCVSY